ncbi:hypothetical protein BYT27DRAFT_7263832 [Phlegmacium glaucopus]|nr:hypothetical protein BYT27DRAFT_7263832 [Phlegmacium glaucopus]
MTPVNQAHDRYLGMADQPALGPDGQLLHASKIVWYNNPDDAHPIQPTSDAQHIQHASPQVVHDWLQLKLNKFGNLVQSHRHCASAGQPHNSHAAPKCKRMATDNPATNADDNNSTTSSADSSSDDGLDNNGDPDIMEISNEEIADMLPSKTVPEVNNRKKQMHAPKPKAKVMAAAPPKKKARVRSVEVEEIEDQDSMRNIAAGIAPSLQHTHSISQIQKSFQKGTGRNLKKSPIYLFYEIVTNGPDSTLGDDGDVHYRCLHGTHKVFLVNNLRVHIKPIYQLYYILKDREEPPTSDEIAIALGKSSWMDMLKLNT